MKTRLRTTGQFTFLLLLFSFSDAFAQPGKNGAGVVNTLNTIVNCYSAVTADVTAGSTSVTTDGTCTLECGDLVMIYQAQGASVNSTNTDQYGTITAYNNSGLYEFNYVVGGSGGNVLVQSPWQNSYTAAGKVQIVKVPQYTTLTVNAGASIVPSLWQDAGGFRKGGIVAIHATGAVTVNGVIQANASAFRSGAVEQNTSNSGGAAVPDWVTTSSSLSAEKGEGIAGFSADYDAIGGRYGRGAPANGGGGGNGHNAGGGGGANANNGNIYNGYGVMCTTCPGTAAWNLDPFFIANGALANSSGGGRGGYTYGANNQNALTTAPANTSWGGDYRRAVGGMGGHPLTIIPATRIFFGGGGGIGDSNNSGNQPGGRGGGIVYIIAPSVGGVGSISANGGNALNQISTNTGGANDAPSGGGGGGSVIVKSTVTGSVAINATGGKGGDQGFLSSESEGPGGGGGGGFVAISAGAPAINVAGGDNGITLSGSLTEFTPNGATSGGAGESTAIAQDFIIYEPVTITAAATTPVCAGNALSFTSTVNFPGGTYAWSGPGGFTSAAANPSIASASTANSGQVQVIYTTPGGCKDTAFVQVVVNPTPIVAASVVNPLCAGACNGSATINFTTNGTPAYTFAWNNGQATQTASNLCAGSYSATITDINGCTASANATITQPVAIAATVAVQNVTCNGSCNGTATVTASGGSAPYQYSINGGAYQASNVFSALCQGNHNVTVRDANNCTFTVAATITQPPVLALSLVSTGAATCGANTGSINVSGSGGTAPYTYSIGGAPQASGVFTNLAPGSYTAVITDANACTATLAVTVTAANSPTASVLSQQNVSCFGGVNGSVLIGVLGGAAPIQYTLNSGTPQLSNSFSNLSAGTYNVSITDANNCSSVTSFTITSPTQLTYTTTVTPASCNGVCDGTILVSPTGGTAPYTYSSNNGTTFGAANPITGRCAGTVSLVVQDANGCLSNSAVTITQPAPLTATYVNTNPLCHDGCDGQIAVTASGGTPGYQYSANGGTLQTSGILTNLCSGNRTVLVQDAHGCQLTSVQTLANPPGFTIVQNSMIESNCGFNNGSLDVSAVGPNAPYTYTLNSGPSQPTGVFNNLLAGAYNIVATDALGCQEAVFFGVNDVEMDGILLTQTDVLCYGGNDGTVEVTNVSGAPPITYELDNNGFTQTNGFFANIPEGSHIVTIYDNGFCIYTLPFTMIQPDEIAFGSVATDNLCNAGSTGEIEFTGVTGGIGSYQYSVDGGISFQPAPTFGSLPAGSYDLIVMDANSCTMPGNAIIDEPTAVGIEYTASDLTCNGNATGFIQLVGTGGTGDYTYSIDNGGSFDPSGAFVSLPADNYNVVVRDENLCEAQMIVPVTEPPLLTAISAATPTLCNASCDGEITVSAAGGTGALQYSSDNGTTYAVTPALGNLCSGSYTLVVRDQNLCQTTLTQAVTSPAAVSATISTLPSTCSQANGEAQVTASGGVGGYTYSNDNGATFDASGTFTSLPAAEYSFVVMDSNNCSFTGTAIVTDESSPQITGVYITEPLCNASCDGEIFVTTTGGSGPLTFSNGGAAQADSTFTAICAGSYTITVTDQNGGTDAQTIVVSEPAVLAFTSSSTDLTCFQNSTGSVEIAATGGTIPYSYSYDNGATFTAADSYNFISAGTYDLVVTDGNGCQATGQETVSEPAPLTAATAITDASCTTFCDGTAIVNAAGGTASAGTPYNYEWSSNVNTSSAGNASDLCAGTYFVTVTDNNGCFVSDTFDIAEPAPFVINGVTWTEPTCTGVCDGTITIDAPGGSSFSFDGGTTSGPSNTLANVCAGIYVIHATNPNGCFAESAAVVEEPLPLQLFATPDSLMCSGDTVPLFAIAVGGTPPYLYNWGNGVTAQTQDVHPETPASYPCYATDANNCQSPATTTNFTMLPALQMSASTDTMVCEGSSAQLQIQVSDGYPDYSYQWSSGMNDTLSSVTVTPTSPTTYTISVTDRCVTKDTTIFVDFYAIPEMTFSADNQQGCAPLTVTFTPDMDPALLGNCNWEFSNGGTSTDCEDITMTFDDPGCYDITYSGTTAEGCPMSASFTSVICVFENPVAEFGYNPSAPTIIENTMHFTDESAGAVSYNWQFSNFGTSAEEDPIFTFGDIDPNEVINVCLEVTSGQGCTDEICKPIKFGDEFSIFVPNAFTPDGDEYNNTFFPVFPESAVIASYDMVIFDRWGEVIFESYNHKIGWDGTFMGALAQDGVYTWLIQLTEGTHNKTYKLNGHITLLR
jgi:large repetitive protein